MTAPSPPPGSHPLPLPTGTLDWMVAQEAIGILSNKWVLPIIAALSGGPLRYSDLHRSIGPAVSQKVLTETLRVMREDRLVVREKGSSSATSVPYELTEFARGLLESLAALAQWYNGASTE